MVGDGGGWLEGLGTVGFEWGEIRSCCGDPPGLGNWWALEAPGCNGLSLKGLVVGGRVLDGPAAG